MGEQTEAPVWIPCGELSLEGALGVIPSARGAVLICHPHPLFGGNMDNPVVQAIRQAFADAGYSTLRFNFRGVGRSTGAFDDGNGEQQDVRSCLEYLSNRFSGPITLSGYSFGSWVNARLLDKGLMVSDHIMVAPPVAFVSFSDISRIPSTRLVVTGENDDIAPPSQVRDMMTWCGIQGPLEVLPGTDHFYNPHSLGLLYQILMRYAS